MRLSDLAPRQYDEVVALLRKHGIQFRETPSGFLGSGAIVVLEDHFPKAKAILREESREFAQRAREEWERDWKADYGSSGIRWFLYKLYRQPGGTLARVVLLVLMVSIFVIYPVWYVVRGL